MTNVTFFVDTAKGSNWSRPRNDLPEGKTPMQGECKRNRELLFREQNSSALTYSKFWIRVVQGESASLVAAS